jgi:hypothetical protein
MSHILKSRRGVDTAPLFIVFAIVVLGITATLAFDMMGRWEEYDSSTRTINEAKRLSQTCEEIKFAGDLGTIQEVKVDIPQKCSITIKSTSLVASCSLGKGKGSIVTTKATMTGSPETIPSGSKTVKIIYASKITAPTAGAYIIYVS